MSKIAPARLSRLISLSAGQENAVAVTDTFSVATDWPAARASLVGKVPADVLPKLDFAVAVSEHIGDREMPELADLRQFALKYNPPALAALAALMPAPADGPAPRPQAAKTLRANLFRLQPTAVLQRMVQDNELLVADAAVRAGISKLFGNDHKQIFPHYRGPR